MILLQCGKVWKTFHLTRHHPPPPPPPPPSARTLENQQLADNFNDFYCRFGKTPHTRPEHLSTEPLTPPATPLSPTPALKISEDDMHQVFKENKRRKAPGPDSVSPACLKTCAHQLAPIFTKIFNRSLELCEVPSWFKCATIIPSQRNPKLLDIMTTDLWL